MFFLLVVLVLLLILLAVYTVNISNDIEIISQNTPKKVIPKNKEVKINYYTYNVTLNNIKRKSKHHSSKTTEDKISITLTDPETLQCNKYDLQTVLNGILNCMYCTGHKTC